jgi:uncharacterized protein (TIGR00251 family)
MLMFEDIPHFAKKNDEGFCFWVKVTPKAAKSRIGTLVDGTMERKMLKVYVTSPPEDNLANIAVIEVLSSYFHKPKSKIQIISGFTAREKRIQILT